MGVGVDIVLLGDGDCSGDGVDVGSVEAEDCGVAVESDGAGADVGATVTAGDGEDSGVGDGDGSAVG